MISNIILSALARLNNTKTNILYQAEETLAEFKAALIMHVIKMLRTFFSSSNTIISLL